MWCWTPLYRDVVAEEGELLHRIKHGGTLPLFTSCCPAWVNFAEKHHPEITGHISTTRSQQCFVLAKPIWLKNEY
ncbi:MAG: [Fe-Fe] hydrogenase large subunit C-terminal domain-containing protein [Desulfobacterales bacterium]